MDAIKILDLGDLTGDLMSIFCFGETRADEHIVFWRVLDRDKFEEFGCVALAFKQ